MMMQKHFWISDNLHGKTSLRKIVIGWLVAASPAVWLAIYTGQCQAAAFSLQAGGYTQNFDGIGSGLPDGWQVATGATSGGLGSAAVFVSTASNSTSWGTSTGQFRNEASDTAGATATPAAQAAATDRALGLQQTGSFGDPGAAFEFEIANTVGLSGLTLSVDLQMLNVQTRSTTYTIDYGLGAAPTSFTALTTWTDPGVFGTTPETNLSFGGALDNLNGPVWIRIVALSASTGSGSRDNVGIDNFALSYTGTPVGNSLVFNPAGANFIWNTNAGNTNWLNGAASSPYHDGDTVNFTDAGVGTVTIDAGGVSPTGVNVSNTTGTYTFTGGPINGNGTLTKTGAGTLALNSANNYAGGTAINGGTVQAVSDAALGAAAGAITFGGGTLQATGDITSARNVSVLATSGTIDTNNHTVSSSGSFTSNAAFAFTKAGSGTLSFTGMTSTNLGKLTISGGTLALSGPLNGTFLAVGTLPTATDGSFVGNLAIGSATSPYQVTLSAGPISGGGQILLAPGSALADGASGSTTISNNIMTTDVGMVFIGGNSGSTMAINSTIGGPGDVAFGSGSGGGSGAGTEVLNSVNNYGGATIIDNNYAAASTNSVGLVQLGVDNALPTGTALSFGRVTSTALTKAGALDLNGHNQTVASLASGVITVLGSPTYSLTNGITNGGSTQSTLTINGSATANYNGPIGAFTAQTHSPTNGAATVFTGTDNIALTLAAANTGNQTLSGTSTYTGPTTINGGTLAVTGSLTASPVVVNSGGALQGTGTLGNTLSVSSGGSVKPGAFSNAVSTTGALTVAGTTTFNNGAALNIVLAGESAGSQYSELHAQGQLNLGGSLNVSLSSFTPNVSDSFDILDWGTLSGTFSSVNLPNGFTWDTSQLYNTGVITVTGTTSFLAGDLNQDTFLSVADVKLMLSALANPDAFSTSSGLTLAQIDAFGDANMDGQFNNADIQALLNQILAGNHSTSAVPEPAGFVLAAVGLTALVRVRRRQVIAVLYERSISCAGRIA